VDCISKGKAHKRYEFGTKVSVATTTSGGFVVGMRALPGNPYDGHTLHEALEQVEILTDRRPDMAFVDRGYRGHGVETVKVFISGARRGVTRTIAKLLRRRSAIELMIGHMKNDGRLTRCPLKETTGPSRACKHALPGNGRPLRGPLRLRPQYPHNSEAPKGVSVLVRLANRPWQTVQADRPGPQENGNRCLKALLKTN
jgi:hypothetical protein